MLESVHKPVTELSSLIKLLRTVEVEIPHPLSDEKSTRGGSLRVPVPTHYKIGRSFRSLLMFKVFPLLHNLGAG